MKQDNHDGLQVGIKLQDALWLTVVKAKKQDGCALHNDGKWCCAQFPRQDDEHYSWS